MEAGLLSLATLALTGLGFIAYNHPRSYRLHFSPVVPFVLGILMVAAAIYARWAELDNLSVALLAAMIFGALVYALVLDHLEDLGVSREKRSDRR